MATKQPDCVRRSGEERYRHLFEHVPICIFVIDLTANPAAILEVNRRAQLVYGYSADELVGMSAAQLVPEENVPVIQAMAQRVRQGPTVTAETIQQITLADGRRLGYAEYGTPDGKPVFYFHGYSGSRIGWLAFDPDDHAARLNARIVAVGRPA